MNSTLSSGLSSLSAVLWADVLKPKLKNISDFKATIIAKLSVVFFGVLGCCVCLLVSQIGGPMTQIAGSLLAVADGPLTGLFLLGCFCPIANAKGAMFGGIVAVITSCWLSLGQNFSKSIKPTPWLPPASTDQCFPNNSLLVTNMSYLYDASRMTSVYNGDVDFSTTGLPELNQEPQGVEKFYTLSYTWIGTLGIVITFVLGIIVSLLTGTNKPGEVHPRYLISYADYILCYLPECIRKHLRYLDYRSVDRQLDDYVPQRRGTIIDMEYTVPPEPGDITIDVKTAMTLNDIDKTAIEVNRVSTFNDLDSSNLKNKRYGVNEDDTTVSLLSHHPDDLGKESSNEIKDENFRSTEADKLDKESSNKVVDEANGLREEDSNESNDDNTDMNRDNNVSNQIKSDQDALNDESKE